MAAPSEFDAYLSYFSQMDTEQLLDFLSNTVPQAGLGQQSLAFLQAFGNRILQERRARELAEQERSAHQQNAAFFEAAAQAAQAAQATQAAGLGAAGQQPNAPQQNNPHMSTSQGTQQPMNYQSNVQQHATVGGRSGLAQALQKGIKPPNFDGTKVVDWIFKINQYLSAIDDQASEIDKIKFACNLLTGKALTWWRHKYTFGLPYYNTFEDFTNELYDHFIDVDYVNKLREQLDNLVQQKGQPVQKYIARFKELQVELGPYSLTDDQARYKFIKGLHNQIRIFTNMSNPPTFDAACQAAVIAEQSLTGTLGVGNARGGGNGDKMDLGAFFATGSNHHSRNNGQKPHPNRNHGKGKQPANDAWKKSATCHHCGKKGHIKPDCRQLKAQQNHTSTGRNHGRNNNLSAQVAQLTAELAALRAAQPSSSKN